MTRKITRSQDFVDHFWSLVPTLLAPPDMDDASISRAIAQKADLQGYQAGKTKACTLLSDCLQIRVWYLGFRFCKNCTEGRPAGLPGRQEKGVHPSI